MNAATKAVATHREIDPDVWANSAAVDKPLTDWLRDTVATTDVVVIGSESVVTALADADLIDEYRLLVFPTAVGRGRRLFPTGHSLELASVAQVGPAALYVLTPDREVAR